MKSNIIDEYGELIEKKKAIEERIEQLRPQILSSALEGENSVTGKTFLIEFIKRVTTEFDSKKVFKLIPSNRFNDIFKVKVTEMKKWLTPEEIEKCTLNSSVSISLQSKRIQK